MEAVDRRTFNRAALLSLAGALVVGRTGWLGVKAPVVAAETFWEAPPRFVGFKPAPDQLLWYGQVIARRSDGTHFFVNVCVPAEDLDGKTPAERADVLQAKFEEAFRILDTFKTCACKLDKECEMHLGMLPEKV